MSAHSSSSSPFHPGLVQRRFQFFFAAPLGEFQKFTGFQIEGNDQVFQGMKAPPFTRIAKFQQSFGEVCQVGIGHHRS